MNSLQVVRDDCHKNRSRLVEFSISSRQVRSLETIMSLSGIDKRSAASHWGWDWDCDVGTCTVMQPWMYRGRIDNALRMVRDRWYPRFRTALELKQEMTA